MTRFSEAVQIMKLLWTEPKVSFHGRYWDFDNVAMEPKPVQKPHLPLWFGGHHENALKRAVKYGNGWMGAGSSSSNAFVRESAQIRQFLDAASATVTFSYGKRVYMAVDGEKRAARNAFASGLASDIKTPTSVRTYRSGAALPR